MKRAGGGTPARTETQNYEQANLNPHRRPEELAIVVSIEAARNQRHRRAALIAAMSAPDQDVEARLWGDA